MRFLHLLILILLNGCSSPENPAQKPKGKSWIVRSEDFTRENTDPRNHPETLEKTARTITETTEIRNDSNKIIYSLSVITQDGKWKDSTETRNEYDAEGKLFRSFVKQKTQLICFYRGEEMFSIMDSSYSCIKTTETEKRFSQNTELILTTETCDNETHFTKDSSYFLAPGQLKSHYTFRDNILSSSEECTYTYDSQNRIQTKTETENSGISRYTRVFRYGYFDKNNPYILSCLTYTGQDSTNFLYKSQSFTDSKGHELYLKTWSNGKPEYMDTVYYTPEGKFEKRVKKNGDGKVTSTLFFVPQKSTTEQISYVIEADSIYHYQVNYYPQNDSVKFQEMYFFDSPVLITEMKKPEIKNCSEVQLMQIDKASGEILMSETYYHGKLAYRQKRTAN